MKLTEANALARTAAYCSKAERCESDILKKLAGWELTGEEQLRIIARLRKEKFLNEERYCRSFVRDKVRFNKWGKVKIIFELRKKQISQNLIDQCLTELDENEFNNSLESILIIKNKSVKAVSNYERRTKLLRFALSRGFSLQESQKVLNKILKQTDDEEYF